jgi:NAD(P)-dependent dehydrogenase (short-subunit alcohol dehydrogenase family)
MQVVVITGLAQGIGREVVKMLLATGDAVAGFDVDEKGLASLEGELAHAKDRLLLETLSVDDRPGIAGFAGRVLEKFGHVDIVLSNVGIGFFGPFEEVDLELANKCMEINVIGTAAIFQAFLPSMRTRGSGRLIAMSSLVGQIPFPFESIYSASKFAVEGLVQSMRYEVEPFGIQVGLIQPAQVSTSFAAKIHKLPPEGSPYRDRADRFINKDNELIKTAPDPVQAACEVVRVLKGDRLKMHNQIDFKSRFFMKLNRVLPTGLRDKILLAQMDIKV